MSNTICHLKGAEAKGNGREGKTSEDEERGLQGCLGLKEEKIIVIFLTVCVKYIIENCPL